MGATALVLAVALRVVPVRAANVLGLGDRFEMLWVGTARVLALSTTWTLAVGGVAQVVEHKARWDRTNEVLIGKTVDPVESAPVLGNTICRFPTGNTSLPNPTTGLFIQLRPS